MATGIIGHNRSDDTNTLIAQYGNDLVDVDNNTGYGLAISSSNDSEFEVFLDDVFWQNFNHTPLTFDGTSWTTKHVAHTPIAKYLKEFKTRMYLGYITINSTNYASRVWYSDTPVNNTIQWGFMSGSNGAVTGGTNRFTAANAGFKTYNIKVGDPLIIETAGNNKKQFTVERVSDNQMLEVTEEFQTTQDTLTYWVGGNWFDVKTDDGDVIKGLSENNDRLLVFKENSLHRYDGSSLYQVKGVPGTSSTRSIVNIRGVTLYFHGSKKDKTGIYMYDGVNSQRVSNAIQPFIDGISASNFGNVIAWREGDVYRAYVGDITNQNSSNPAYNISRSKGVISYDVSSNRWDVGNSAHTIKAAGYFRESGSEKIFLQDDSGKVFETPSGNSFGSSDIPFKLELYPVYPRGSEVMNMFTRIKVVSRDARGVHVAYKLWDTPLAVDGEYTGLGDIENDTTEFLIPTSHNRGCGIQLKFYETGQTEPSYHIEKISIYSTQESLDTPERKRQQ